jgi:plasmid stabilization system protein ParE
MVFKIIIKPIVWIDLDEIISWYENERKGLGKKFFASFEIAKERIATNPKAFPDIIPGVKRILIKKFPYKVFYTISDTSVFIIGVSHSKRSNAYIRKRLRTMQ